MLVEQRFRMILDILERQGSVTVQELMEVLHTSESTIRRDLNELDKQRQLNKVHGGAVAIQADHMTRDPELSLRQEMNLGQKNRIAQYCASIINDTDCIFIDAGTTTELIIDYLNEKNIIYVTNGINVAKKLALKGFRVHLLGGELKPTTEAVVGSEAIEYIEKYHFTKGFFGTNGVSLEAGFTTPEVTEAQLKKKAMSKCKEVYVICDSSKFNQTSSISFADFTEAIIVTSSIKDKAFKDYNNILEVDNI